MNKAYVAAFRKASGARLMAGKRSSSVTSPGPREPLKLVRTIYGERSVAIEGPAATNSGRSPLCPPWNKGKLVGPKRPLRPSPVWSIRTKLQMERRVRDLALFNLAIDSKLRGCDVVAVRVNDVAPSGYALDRATVRQRKTGRPVHFELTEQTRQALDEYLRLTSRKSGDFLFAGVAILAAG
jgi:hypothetical protein